MTPDGQMGQMDQMSPNRPDNAPGHTTLSHDRESRPRDEDRLTRKPLAWWDRIKIVIAMPGKSGAHSARST